MNYKTINPGSSHEPMSRRPRRLFLRFASVLALVALTGCATPAFQDTAATGAFVSKPQMLAEKGIKVIEEGKYNVASAYFNRALKLDTTSSYLQLLNGLAYHLRALKGDISLYPMAKQGYELALKFDKSNWMANYYLGLLYMERRNFEMARESFAEAALYKTDDPDILYNLAIASYYSKDPVTAAGILKRLRRLKLSGVRELRASSMVMAALGNHRKAEEYLSQFKKASGNIHQAAFVAGRLNDWRNFYSRNKILKKVQGTDENIPPDDGSNDSATPDDGSNDSATTDDQPDQGAVTVDVVKASKVPDQGGDDEEGDADKKPAYDPLALTDEEAAAAQDQKDAPVDPYKMVIVDVVIIRTEEDLKTSKGVNLLNGLTLQFGTASEATSGLVFKNMISKVIGNQTRTITRAIGINSINYSLNIANSNTTRNEILARPTIVAMAGEQSEFFSGVEVDAAAVGGAASDGSTISVQKEIGVKLAITPEFLDDGRIKLNVIAERTFLTTPNTTSVTFTLRVDTSKTSVSANVAMNFGETLILSGLSEKETERIRDGVPLLQDIPVVQYLFSKATTRDFQKSVLILLTPRLPSYIFQPEQDKKKSRASMSKSERVLSEFQARYSDWFKPYPNWASVFHHMQANQLYREFRTGDVSLEKWVNQSTLKERLDLAKEFLFY